LEHPVCTAVDSDFDPGVVPCDAHRQAEKETRLIFEITLI